jgi:hypothetical protein
MNLTKDKIEKISTNGYELDFGTVFEQAFENYKKIVLYSGLMLLVFFVILSFLMMTGINSYAEVENMEEFSKKLTQFSELKEIPLDIALKINAGMLLLSGLLNPFMAGFYKMADCSEKGEEFHVSSMFTYYRFPFFSNIFIATFIIGLSNLGLSTLLEFAGLSTIGALISFTISFMTFLTIPLIVFGKLDSIEAIKSSIIIVSKQPLVLLGLLIVAFIAALIGVFAFFIGILFTMPFIYSMIYVIYGSIIGIDAESEIDQLESNM